MGEKTLDYYLGLSYNVQIRSGPGVCQAWIEELPRCRVEVGKDESVEDLFRRLEVEKGRWIRFMLVTGEEVPEPREPDPFWDEFDPTGELEGWEVDQMIRDQGPSTFPLRVLESFWLEELGKIGLFRGETPTDPPPKGRWRHDHEDARPGGAAYPVRLGKAGKWAWVRVGGPRSRLGHRNLVVLDEPLATETAIIAALTVLGGWNMDGAALEPLCEALSGYAGADPEVSGGKSLKGVYDEFVGRDPAGENPGAPYLTI
jgi:hypothetical protein